MNVYISSCLLLTLFCSSILGAETWQIEDPALDKCLAQIAKKRSWHKVSDFTEVRCHSKGIASLGGLEQFTALKSLSLHNNRISEVQASFWPQLEELNLAKNKLGELELQGLHSLKRVFVFGNKLETIRLENLTQLENFKANGNQLQRFDYQGLPALEKIYLFDNQLENLDIYQLPSIKYMDVRQNPMPDQLYEAMDKLMGVTVLHDGNEEDWQ